MSITRSANVGSAVDFDGRLSAVLSGLLRRSIGDSYGWFESTLDSNAGVVPSADPGRNDHKPLSKDANTADSNPWVPHPAALSFAIKCLHRWQG